MQLFVHIFLENNLTLPINYNHILQAIIYNAVYDRRYASMLHEKGYTADNRSYKLFQFSQLGGQYTIKNKNITFRDEVWFEVRSIYPEFILSLKKSIEEKGVTFGKMHCDRIELLLRDHTVESEEIEITMLTPVTVHQTDPITGKTKYYRPDEPEFRELIAENFVRKYEAYTGVAPNEPVIVEAASFDEKDKCVTTYKDFYICGWRGRYIIAGQRKYLDFLYQTGLGDRNSQGFGMFDFEDWY